MQPDPTPPDSPRTEAGLFDALKRLLEHFEWYAPDNDETDDVKGQAIKALRLAEATRASSEVPPVPCLRCGGTGEIFTDNGWGTCTHGASEVPTPPGLLATLTNPKWLSDEIGMHTFVNERECDCGDWDAFTDRGVTFDDHLANEIIAAAHVHAVTPTSVPTPPGLDALGAQIAQIAAREFVADPARWASVSDDGRLVGLLSRYARLTPPSGPTAEAGE